MADTKYNLFRNNICSAITSSVYNKWEPEALNSLSSSERTIYYDSNIAFTSGDKSIVSGTNGDGSLLAVPDLYGTLKGLNTRINTINETLDDDYAEKGHTHYTIDNDLTVTGELTMKSNIKSENGIFQLGAGTNYNGYVLFQSNHKDPGGKFIFRQCDAEGKQRNEVTLLDETGNTILPNTLTVTDSLTANPYQTTIISQAVSITGETTISNKLNVGGELDVNELITLGSSAFSTTTADYLICKVNDVNWWSCNNKFNSTDRKLMQLYNDVSANKNLRVGGIIQLNRIMTDTAGATISYNPTDNQLDLGINGSGTRIYINGSTTKVYGTLDVDKNITCPKLNDVRSISFINSTKDDAAGIVLGETNDNGTFLEISTSDNGNEPIYVRQYKKTWHHDDSGALTHTTEDVQNSATLLDASGNTSFPGTVIAGGSIKTSHGDVSAVNVRATDLYTRYSVRFRREDRFDDTAMIILRGDETETNNYLEIATSNEGVEPICLTQYSGPTSNPWQTKIRTATLLDAEGNTSFPGTLNVSTICADENVQIEPAVTTTTDEIPRKIVTYTFPESITGKNITFKFDFKDGENTIEETYRDDPEISTDPVNLGFTSDSQATYTYNINGSGKYVMEFNLRDNLTKAHTVNYINIRDLTVSNTISSKGLTVNSTDGTLAKLFTSADAGTIYFGKSTADGEGAYIDYSKLINQVTLGIRGSGGRIWFNPSMTKIYGNLEVTNNITAYGAVYAIKKFQINAEQTTNEDTTVFRYIFPESILEKTIEFGFSIGDKSVTYKVTPKCGSEGNITVNITGQTSPTPTVTYNDDTHAITFTFDGASGINQGSVTTNVDLLAQLEEQQDIIKTQQEEINTLRSQLQQQQEQINTILQSLNISEGNT